MQVLHRCRPALRRHRGHTQHNCGAITVAASEGGRPAAAAVRVATSWVERVGAEEVGRTTRERRARGPRPMGGGMEEAATKRAAKGAVRARR